jgi:hypothetical protein
MPARWDNFALYGQRGDTGGVELERGVMRLVRMDYAGSDYARLSPSVPVPRRRWFGFVAVADPCAGPSSFYIDRVLPS